jgi:beta-N-acetylhexosaminidase
MAVLVVGPAAAQGPAEDELDALIEQMDPAQRVGQLVLVTFGGSDTRDGSDVARLITDYHVGGVLVDPANGNFSNDAGAPRSLAELSNRLQALADAAPGTYVPLFIAFQQEGDGPPAADLRGGTTPIPSAMAIGATFNATHAHSVGELVGRQMAAVGVNLLMGPSLDVLASTDRASSADLGVRTFGGSAYWVGQMGRAYIQGVHAGSRGRVGTVARHFPGLGNADRRPEQEAAVVERSLEELVAQELVPFKAVMGGDDAQGVTDAVLTSPARYSAVQPDLDRAIILDPAGLRRLVASTEPLGKWRSDHLLISDGLGLPAVAGSFRAAVGAFPVNRIVSEALHAGNDMLTLRQFGVGSSWDEKVANMRAALVWLTVQYERDDALRATVDESLRRVLRLKRRLYPVFELSRVRVVPEQADAAAAAGRDVVAVVARDAVTLVAPRQAREGGAAPSPAPGDNILVVTDAREVSECPACPPSPAIAADALAQAILRIHGPEGTGRVAPEQLRSITYSQLKEWLVAKGAGTPSPGQAATAAVASVQNAVEAADWIVFAALDIYPALYPDSDALRLLLAGQLPEVSAKPIVVIALNAPYFLDATEVSRLTAYYGLYSKTEPFIDAAARALFRELPAQGSSPVAVPGANYDLQERLRPDPNQKLTLAVERPAPGDLLVGNSITVTTGVIVDHNGHPVVDGTQVVFKAAFPLDNTFAPDQIAATQQGVASRSIVLDRGGQMEIRAQVGDSLESEATALSVGDAADRTNVRGSGSPAGVTGRLRPSGPVDWRTLMLSLTAIILAGVLVYMVEGVERRPVRVVRLFLISMAWGLVGYVLVGTGYVRLDALVPGIDGTSVWQAPLASFAMALAPLVPAFYRSARRTMLTQRGG